MDVGQTQVLAGTVHPLAAAGIDQGPVDDAMPLNFVVMLFKPSDAQQADMDSLLASQQNPASPLFHKWLTPEEYAGRFGLSAGDQSKAAAWLHAEGLTVKQLARGRNWIAFDGTAGQVSRALHTRIHRFLVNGEAHFASAGDVSVPVALAGVTGGFIGLDDFRLKPNAIQAAPEITLGDTHYLTPADFSTIYDLAPLYQAGTDGSGQSIAVVGASDVLLSDIRAFRTTYGLPANDPKMVPYSSADPGFNGAQLEGSLDLEWAGAIAPKATIYYVYGPDALTAILAAVDENVAPIVSNSYGACEIGWRQSYWRAVAQQANAQGITIVSASGDSGAAGCDPQGYLPFANLGRTATFPSVLPEVTGVGGTQFVEGTGTYWALKNSANYGSALSYIPEAAWNESGTSGLLSTGGGASAYYSKPAWQTGPGVPAGSGRDVPDVAFSAALHDQYMIAYLGYNAGVAGTSCAAPSFAGILALLNQYQVAKGFQKQPGLGNINPQLYRLAQSVPSVFHDVVAGSNVVPCSQGSPDCTTGSFGYSTGPGYDAATGLGSVDASNLVTQWNTKTNGVAVALTASPATVTLNGTVQLTATVTAASGTAVPTGTVDFSSNGVALGTAALVSSGGRQTASVSFPAYLFSGQGAFAVIAAYSGDASFSSAGAETYIGVTVPASGAAVIPSLPDTVWPSLPPDAQGPTWQTTLWLSEVAGVATSITGFTIDGIAQPLSQYFPAGQIMPFGSASATVIFRNMAVPVVRTFGFTGTDATGQNWSRQVPVTYRALPPGENFNLTATPLIVNQDPTAAASCQWPVQLTVDDLGGFSATLTGLYAGSADLSAQIPAIFGTPRLTPWGSLQGKLCFSGVTPPASDFIQVVIDDALGQEVAVSFAPPVASPATLSVSPAAVALTGAVVYPPYLPVSAQATLSIGITGKTQSWTATILPTNRTAAWLSASQYSGAGPAQVILNANGAGFEPGVYRATVLIQSPDSVPETVSVPVMYVLGSGASGSAIASAATAGSAQTTGSPGMLFSVYGTQLSAATQAVNTAPLPFTLAGVSATVNGVAAPLSYVSPGQINLQIPYEAGAGPAVLGIDNNGQVAGFAFQIAPAAPAVFADASGNLNLTAIPGGAATIYLTGAGDVYPPIFSGDTPSSTDPVSQFPTPLLPLSVTVGGVPALVQWAGIPPGLVGEVQVNFWVPLSVSVGTQPVIVTVGGKASQPVNLKVVAGRVAAQ